MIFIFLSCTDGKKETTEPVVEPCVDCVLQDSSNYSFTSDIDIATFPLQPQSDVLIDWTGLSSDVQGHAVTEGMVNQVSLVVFLNLDTEEIKSRLANDTLLQADISLYLLCTPEEEQCSLGDFGILQANLYAPDHFEDGQGIWMLALRSPDTLGAHSFAFLIPDETSTETQMLIDNETASLHVDVDFRNMQPLLVPASTNQISIDWRELTKDGLGNDAEPSKIDGLFVGRYSRSLEELENDFFDLDREYQEFWSMSLDNEGVADLSGLEGFGGFDNNSTWLLALQCSTCLNPAPRFITQVVVPE